VDGLDAVRGQLASAVISLAASTVRAVGRPRDADSIRFYRTGFEVQAGVGQSVCLDRVRAVRLSRSGVAVGTDISSPSTTL